MDKSKIKRKEYKSWTIRLIVHFFALYDPYEHKSNDYSMRILLNFTHMTSKNKDNESVSDNP